MTLFVVSTVEVSHDGEVSISSDVELDEGVAKDMADTFMLGAVGRFLDIDDFGKMRDAVDKWAKERSSIYMGRMKWERIWKSDQLGGTTIITCVQETEI